jgi:imidazolonepropionase-like amidohydrolase
MGISPIDSLRMATVNAAELLGVDDRGQLKVGMRVDIIAVSKNPLEDITAMEAVSFVMK